MEKDESRQEIRIGKVDSRREETNKAYAEIVRQEREQRREKQMRLRQFRLVKH
jgi:hypothetical protein